MVEATHYFDTWSGQSEEKVNVLRCNAKETYLLPPKAEHKGNYYEFGDIENNPMPAVCDELKVYYDSLPLIKN
jgi:hypothetical protein